MTVGAIAVAHEHPELAEQILHHAIESIPLAMQSYAPDGAWGEGPGYWSYATTYNVVMLAAMESAMGDMLGLERLPGFEQNGLFPIYMTGTSGLGFNFADAGAGPIRSHVLFWLDRTFENPAFSHHQVSVGSRGAREMLWYRRPGKSPEELGLPLDKHWRGVDVVTMRSSWSDPDATFVGIQAGSNHVDHNHLDLGVFVLDALGERWAVDLGGDDYNLPAYFLDKRYTYYRLRAEGHNTLVINPGRGPDQDPRGTTEIVQLESTPEAGVVTADLTNAYRNAGDVKGVERTIALERESGVVTVTDRIEASEADVWWFMHTRADVKLADHGRTATLTQKGKTLTAKLVKPGDAKLQVVDARPLPSSPDPKGQDANEGVRKLAIRTTLKSTTTIEVTLSPKR
jgi:hypothetical protein